MVRGLGARISPLSLIPLLLLAAPLYAQDDHSNTAAGATVLRTDGTQVAGAIEVAGDLDVFRFPAQAGDDYVVVTSRLAAGMDSILDLYDPLGHHRERNDDFGGSFASRISFTAQRTATYWLVVSHYNRTSGTGTYALAVRGAPAVTVGTSSVATAPVPATSTSALRLSSAVFDPKLDDSNWSVSTQAPGSGAYTANVAVYAGNSRVASIAVGQRTQGQVYQDGWDGRDDSGAVVAAGAYTVRFSANNTRAEETLNVVRLGVRSIVFQGASRVSLAYHRASSWSGSTLPVDALGPAWTLGLSTHSAGCLDASTDRRLSGPNPWTDTDGPPRTSSGSVLRRGRSLPVAYVGDTTPVVRVLLGESASAAGVEVGCGYPISGRPIRIVATVGGSVTDASQAISPDGQATLDLGRLPRAVDRHSLTIRFRFEYFDGGWLPVPGNQPTRHRIYTVVAEPTTTMIPAGTPWVAALDLVAGWSNGQAVDVSGVLDACVRGVNTAGLRYDVVVGAPAYTNGWRLQSPDLDLDAFLDGHANGNVVNCLDCASLVSKLAAQAGVDSHIMVLGWDFRLNWIRGIGYSSFTHSLFNGNHAFSYHAVATGDRGSTVNDACLSVDADTRPWSAPHAEGLPLSMPWTTYRGQLSPDFVPIQDLGRATIR